MASQHGGIVLWGRPSAGGSGREKYKETIGADAWKGLKINIMDSSQTELDEHRDMTSQKQDI